MSNIEGLSDPLGVVDPAIAELIEREAKRQSETLSMVVAENLVPRAVLEAHGSILTNKYADGYPGHRRYDGCEVVDEIEELAISRVKALFGVEYANVQPYSGSNANQAVFFGLLSPGDTVLGLDFAWGGHPTHHDKVTFAGRFYNSVTYHLAESTRLVDMDEVATLAKAHRPRLIIAGWSCYQRHLDFAAFRAIADSVGAYLLVDMAHFCGLVAAKEHPDPVPYADVCTFTTHKTLGGSRGGAIIARAELGAAIDEAVFPGTQGCVPMHIVAGKAVSFHVAGTKAFAERTRQAVVGARIIADALHAAEETTRMKVVTGGKDVHQFLIDTADADVDSGEVLDWLHEIGLHGNAMRIAFDVRQPPGRSGLRLGTPSLATRGFDDLDFRELADVLTVVLSPERKTRHDELAERVRTLAKAHPTVS